jgi:hypothetical protein
MKQLAALIALVVVVLGVAWATSSTSGASLGFCTVLVAGGVLAHKYALSVQAAGPAAPKTGGPRGFVIAVIQNTVRFVIAAVVIAWMIVSLQWFIGA